MMNSNALGNGMDWSEGFPEIDPQILDVLLKNRVVKAFSTTDVADMKREVENLKARCSSVEPSEIASLVEREAQLRKKVTIRLYGYVAGGWYSDIWSKRMERRISQNASKVRMILSSHFVERLSRAKGYLEERAGKEVSRQYAYDHEANSLRSQIDQLSWLPNRVEVLEKEISRIEGSLKRSGRFYVFTQEADRYVRRISERRVSDGGVPTSPVPRVSEHSDSIQMDFLYWNMIAAVSSEVGNDNDRRAPLADGDPDFGASGFTHAAQGSPVLVDTDPGSAYVETSPSSSFWSD